MEPDVVGGFLDALKPDPAKIDKALMKEGLGKCIDSLKPATTWPMNFDDAMYDQLKNIAYTYVDQLAVVRTDNGPMVVGDSTFVEYTDVDVDAYLNTFSGVDAEVRNKLRRKPRTLRLVKEEFTAQEQAKLVGNPFLIGLLMVFGPLIVEWIKKLLSK